MTTTTTTTSPPPHAVEPSPRPNPTTTPPAPPPTTPPTPAPARSKATGAPAVTEAGVTWTRALPKLDGEPVRTRWFDLGKSQAQVAIRLRGITTFDGPSGTGKTTTAVSLARESPMRFAYLQLRHRAGTNEVAEAIYQALHNGHRLGSRASKRHYIDESTDSLCSGRIGLIADEVHYIGVPGMILLAQMWESVRMYTGQGFPLFLIGSEVNGAISSAPELDTRVIARASFHFLEGDDLLAAINTMDSRCAATPDQRLLDIDKACCRGRLRLWRTFIRIVNLNPATAATEISRDEARAFLLTQGKDVPGLQ